MPLLVLVSFLLVGAGVDGQGFYRGFNRYGGYRGYGGARFASYGGQSNIRRNRISNLSFGSKFETARSPLTISAKNVIASPTTSTLAPSTEKIQSTATFTTTQSTTPSTTRASIVTRTPTVPMMQQSNKNKEEKDPYLTISPKFSVIPAVPGVKTPQRNDRLPKNILPEQDAPLLIPERFMPVAAVPAEIDEKVLAESVSVSDIDNSLVDVKPSSSSDLVVNADKSSDDLLEVISVTEERKQFKRCHGKCVQKFCLPVGDLVTFDKCTDKCKGICTQ